MSVHGERPSDLVRERTIADRETERILYGHETRSGLVGPATPINPPSGVENGVAYDAYCIECGQRVEHRLGAWICPTHFDRGHVRFEARTSTATPVEVGERHAQHGAAVQAAAANVRVTLADREGDGTDSMNSGPVCGTANGVRHFDGRGPALAGEGE